jgi:glycyl-tRNA synthetase beta chain
MDGRNRGEEGSCRVSLPFLLEIGTEEIPDWMIVPALKSLESAAEQWLGMSALTYTNTQTDGTPRRLVLRIEGLPKQQNDAVVPIQGPPESIAFKNGSLTPAGLGFAKKVGATPDAILVEETPKGRYLVYRRVVPGKRTEELLAETLPIWIHNIYFPKTMRWLKDDPIRFIRPIRWLVALLDDKVIDFQIGGVRPGNTSVGHRLFGKESIPVSAQDFEEQLRHNGVILSADHRRKKIESDIALLLNQRPLKVKSDVALMNTLIYTTEFPTPILGAFDQSYLDLPHEVLVTVMRHHQKYLSLEDDSGALAPYFIAVMNTKADPEGLVRSGNERVLRARFNDARFFWTQDQKKKLRDRRVDLAKVTFQAKLGSYLDKTHRVVSIVETNWPGNNDAGVAALLSKCDLTTDMVKEFTDLQGIVGGLYARAQGESEGVWRAIYDHYKPLSMEGEIPSTENGRIVSLADKWDTLVECFKVGMAPTGSKDPFGLRRAAQGVVRIIVEGQIKFDFPGMMRELEEFMRDRVEYYFRDVRGFAYDEVRACMAPFWTNLTDFEYRLQLVHEIRSTPDFEPVAVSFKRIKNILKDAPIGALEVQELAPGPERELYDEVENTIGQPLGSRIRLLRPKIDHFFDKVLVNATDPAVRKNRLALLHKVLTTFSTIADFSEIVTERQS